MQKIYYHVWCMIYNFFITEVRLLSQLCNFFSKNKTIRRSPLYSEWCWSKSEQLRTTLTIFWLFLLHFTKVSFSLASIFEFEKHLRSISSDPSSYFETVTSLQCWCPACVVMLTEQMHSNQIQVTSNEFIIKPFCKCVIEATAEKIVAVCTSGHLKCMHGFERNIF